MTERVIRHATIRGRVQGVGYRDWTRYVARERGVEGWVRNRKDGSVEAVFAGMREAVAGMLLACRRGPPNCVIESIDEREAAESDLSLRGQKGFAILPTL
jgi:acylphosphatase